ncbi:hypothetical protein ACQPYE_16495 [Actinosynnema sp. CA-299493]
MLVLPALAHGKPVTRAEPVDARIATETGDQDGQDRSRAGLGSTRRQV